MQNLPQTPISILLSGKRKVGHAGKRAELIGLETNKPGDLFLKEVCYIVVGKSEISCLRHVLVGLNILIVFK
jgi:hypothetical protein